MKNRMTYRTIYFKCIIVAVVFIFMINTMQPAFANMLGRLRVMHEYRPRILINGTYLAVDVIPEVSDDRVALVPLRAVFEAAGYSVRFDSTANQEIVDLLGGNKLALDITNGEAFLSGERVGIFQYKINQGVTMVTPEFLSLPDSMDAVYDVATHTILISVKRERSNDVIFFDRGEKNISLPSGNVMNARLNGGISVPESDNNPVVIILHGSHPLESSDDNRYDLGYSYLLKEFASGGYVALSLNVNMQYSLLNGEPIGQERVIAIVKDTISALKAANLGEYDGFGMDLKGKLDLMNLVFIGHSRGAAGVFYSAKALAEDQNVNVTGLLYIAPTDIFVEDLTAVTIPTAMIVPELDGDVISLDGLTYFDVLASQQDLDHDVQLIYLYGANHNAFNEAVLPQDLGKIWYQGDRTTIPAAEQRNFTVKYALAIANQVITGRPLNLIGSSLDENLFGSRAIVSNRTADSSRLFLAHDDTVTASRVGLEKVISSTMMNINTAGLFSPGGFSQSLELLRVSWEEKDAYVDFALGKAMDKTGKLSLYLAQDSTSDLNNKQNQSFRIELIDRAGNVAWFLLDSNTPALAYHSGHPIFEGDIFSSITPLGIVEIPFFHFNQIDSIDITQVQTVRFRFSENTSGSIMVRAIFGSLADAAPDEKTPPAAGVGLLILGAVIVAIIATIILVFLRKRKR